MNPKRTLTTLMCFAILTQAADVVSDKCFEELVELPNTKANFSMSSFPKELATTVVKVQGGAKFGSIPLLGSMLGPGPDDKLTEAGITVGCAKQIPTDAGNMKSLLINVGVEMGKGVVAGKLGLKRDELPSSLSELKDFAIKTAALKAGEALGIEEGEIPTDIKGVENLISTNIKKQAAIKLGVEESSIPSNKSELSGFIRKAATAKIASELGINPTEVNLDKASLAGYASENEALAPIAGLANAANILEVFGSLSQLSALTGGGGGGGSDNETDGDGDGSPKDNPKNNKEEAKESNDKSTRFGIKLAYNGSTVFFEGTNSELGHGVEAGLVVNIPISTSLEFSVGANGIYRKPNNREDSINVRSELIEYVVSLPVLLQYNISSFYLQTGAQVDVPVKKELKITKGTEEKWEECPWRNSFDLGLVLGFGFRFNEHFAIDIKAIGAATEYNKDIGGYKLIQGDAGLNYFF